MVIFTFLPWLSFSGCASVRLAIWTLVTVCGASSSREYQWVSSSSLVCAHPPGANCIKIGLPGKLILKDYFTENRTSRRPFLLLRIRLPGRPTRSMFYKGHLYKRHSQNFEKRRGQTIVIPDSLGDKRPPLR